MKKEDMELIVKHKWNIKINFITFLRKVIIMRVADPLSRANLEY